MKTSITIAFTLLLALPTAAADDALMETACFDEHTYEVWQSDSTISWSVARSRATDLGGQLVTVASAAENQFVTKLAARYDVLEDTGAVPLAGSDSFEEGDWNWETGEPLGFSAWRQGEPNGGLRENVIELCVRDKCRAGSWNDAPDNQRFLLFVVEYPNSAC